MIGGSDPEETDLYRMLLDRQIDAITFTSASTVRNLATILGPDQTADLLRTTVVACIGPVTAEAAQRLGIHTAVMPARYTIPDLVDALVEHFCSRKEALAAVQGSEVSVQRSAWVQYSRGAAAMPRTDVEPEPDLHPEPCLNLTA